MQTTAASKLKAPSKPPTPVTAPQVAAETVTPKVVSSDIAAVKPPVPKTAPAPMEPKLQLNKIEPATPTLNKASNTNQSPSPARASAVVSAPAPQVPAAAKQKAQPAKNETQLKNKPKRKVGQKQIPTILGLVVLVGSLIAGVLLFGNGTGVFAPRATPETTPKNIQTSNVSDKAFSISFFTDEATVAYVKYGTDANDLKKQASDDRDQLSGMVKPYRLHQVTVRGLKPNTTYYYLLGTGTKDTFDNDGVPYQLQTAATPTANSPNNQTIYGKVTDETGSAAEGSIVFVDLDGVGTLSTLVKSSGSWAISLSNAFNTTLDAYPNIADTSALSIRVQGINPSLTALQTATVATAQPVADIALGSAGQNMAGDDRSELLGEETMPMASDSAAYELETGPNQLAGPDSPVDSSEAAALASEVAEESQPASGASALAELSKEERLLDLAETDETATESTTVIKTTQPVIQTNLPANITVQIEVHSDTAISQTAQTDADGNVSLDVAALGKNLEPGEHTATYSYIDPLTGEEVVKSYTFMVADDAVSADELGRGATEEATGGESASFDFSNTDDTQTLASTETYGSGNPYYPTTSPTASPTPSATPSTIMETTTSSRSTTVSTASGTYNAGSTFNTLAMIVAGFFFMATGFWSFLLAKEFKK